MSSIEVPVIDLSPFYSGDPEQKMRVAQELDSICQNIGFLVVTGHSVNPTLIKAMQEVSLEFMALPESEKLKLTSSIDPVLRGYSPLKSEGLSYSIGEETPGDIKEIVSMGPPGSSEASYVMGEHYYSCDDAANCLFLIFGQKNHKLCAQFGKNIFALWKSLPMNFIVCVH